MKPLVVAIMLGLAAVVWSCGSSDGERRSGTDAARRTETRTSRPVAAPEPQPVPDAPPDIPSYEPESGEDFPAGKRLAGRVVQEAMTYARGAAVSIVAGRVASTGRGGTGVAASIAPLVEDDRRSWARIEYAQLSGATASSAGMMVVARQTTSDRLGDTRSVTRVVDVRLRLVGGAWALDRIGSLGGAPIPRPDDLSPAAERVVEHPAIDLPDSARWDIYRRKVDPALLEALARAADRYPLRVTVIDSGHPPNVWGTTRRSAHGGGKAVDIWSVDGRRVIAQREIGSPAFDLARSFVRSGAAQVGSPWILGRGGRASFTDVVHEDHIHLQQAR